MSEILNLGGYGGFIWSAWGIALVVLAALVVVSLKSMRARERALAEMEAQAPRRRRGAAADNPADAIANRAAGKNAGELT